MENIGERFIAINPINKSQTTVNLTNIEDGRIHKGLNKVVATVLSKDGDEDVRKKEIPMIRKKIESADDYCEYWERLKKASIPTIPTVRKINENEVLMTDLTKNESSFYGKDSFYNCFDRYKKNEINILDKHFLNIEVSAIEEKIKEVSQKANENNIVLPLDDPFDLLVHPNGDWEVLVLDLAKEDRNFLESETRILNNDCVNNFLKLVKLNRDSLLGKQPPAIVMLNLSTI